MYIPVCIEVVRPISEAGIIYSYPLPCQLDILSKVYLTLACDHCFANKIPELSYLSISHQRLLNSFSFYHKKNST